MRRYYKEAFNESRTELLEELIAENVANHHPVLDETLAPEEANGFEGFVRHVEAAREAFPDARVTIEEMLADYQWRKRRVRAPHGGRLEVLATVNVNNFTRDER